MRRGYLLTMVHSSTQFVQENINLMATCWGILTRYFILRTVLAVLSVSGPYLDTSFLVYEVIIIIIIISLFKVGFLTVISLDKLFTPTR